MKNLILVLVINLVALMTHAGSRSEAFNRVHNLESWTIDTGFTFDSKGVPLVDSSLWKKDGNRFTSATGRDVIDLQTDGSVVRIGHFNNENPKTNVDPANHASVTTIVGDEPESHTMVTIAGAFTVTPRLCRDLAKKVGAKDLNELEEKGKYCSDLVSAVTDGIPSDKDLEGHLRELQKKNVDSMGAMASARFVGAATKKSNLWSTEDKEGYFFNKDLKANAGRTAYAISQTVMICSKLFPNALTPSTATIPADIPAESAK